MSNQTTSSNSQIKVVGIGVALVVLVLFIALNFDEVEINMLLFTQTIRLGFGLIFTALLGFLVGYFVPRRR